MAAALPCDEYYIHRVIVLGQVAKELAGLALDPVALDGGSHLFLGDYQSQAMVGQRVEPGQQEEMFMRGFRVGFIEYPGVVPCLE